MVRAFWRAFYAIRYWRVFLPVRGAQSEPKPKARSTSLAVRATLILVFLIPVGIGMGFGYLAWTHGKRLENQRAVDSDGVPVLAQVEGTKIQEIQHSSTRDGSGERYTPAPSYFCHIGVRYSAPGSDAVLRKQFRFEDDTICKRYKTGDAIAGKLLVDEPEKLILDEGRLDVFWYWTSLLLFVLFALVPIFLLARGMVLKSRL